MNKKKIVHIIPRFDLGGVQTGILYSLEELNKSADFTVLVIGKLDNEWLGSLSPLLKKNIISAGSGSLIPGWFKAYRLLKKLNPDIIISSLWKSVPLSVAYKLFNKSVLLCGFYHNTKVHHFIEGIFTKMQSRFEDVAFADSTATKAFIEKYYAARNPVVIPYNFAFIKNTVSKKLNPASIRIAYFGRITKAKRIDRAINFCRLCKERGLIFSFDIYGNGELEKIQQQVKEMNLSDTVFFKDIIPLPQVLPCMQQYDFLLQLSDNEGMALSVVEAMNTGLVPIVTPVGEIANYTKDGVNAIWLMENFEDNLETLVDKLIYIISNEEIYLSLSAAAAHTFNKEITYGDAIIMATTIG
jgi:glycosyltransferase involved in cell wall biosynthesis